MEYLLLFLLMLLFLLSYFSTGKDFFAPTTMMVISFALASIFSIYVSNDVDYRIRSETMWLIVSFLFVGVITGALCHSLVACFRVREVEETSTPLPLFFSLFCIAFTAVTAFLYLRFIRQIGGGFGSFSQIMTSFRSANAYSTDEDAQTPMYLKQMMNMLKAIFFIHTFDLMRNYTELSGKRKLQHIVVMGLTLAISLLSGGRASAIANIIGCVALFHFIRIQKIGKYKTYSLSFTLKMIVVVLIAAVMFYAVKELVGRVSDDSFLEYISHYFGTGIINLDLFLKNPPAESKIWGKETFYSIINILRRFGILDIQHYLIHREFRFLHGVSMGNVYTMFRGLLYDFGTAGALTFFVLQCVVVSVLYEITKRKKSSVWILFFSNMYYAFPLASFNDSFYSGVVSVGFCVQCIMILLLYELFSKKRIRIVIKKTRKRRLFS